MKSLNNEVKDAVSRVFLGLFKEGWVTTNGRHILVGGFEVDNLVRGRMKTILQKLPKQDFKFVKSFEVTEKPIPGTSRGCIAAVKVGKFGDSIKVLDGFADSSSILYHEVGHSVFEHMKVKDQDWWKNRYKTDAEKYYKVDERSREYLKGVVGTSSLVSYREYFSEHYTAYHTSKRYRSSHKEQSNWFDGYYKK